MGYGFLEDTRMRDFWRSCDYRLLARDAEGLIVSDDFLRQFFSRPELVLDEGSCREERALHARLMERPKTSVTREQIELIADANARENWQLWLRFRDHLLRAPT